MLRQRLVMGCLAFAMATPALADNMVPVDVRTRARGADRVVVAEVGPVESAYQRNEHGDALIVSRAELRVQQVLKGQVRAGESQLVEVEGGTVGDITLRVSDMPRLSRGERAIFFLSRNRQGRLVPHLRGLGVLRLDATDRVQGTNLTLDDVRQMLQP